MGFAVVATATSAAAISPSLLGLAEDYLSLIEETAANDAAIADIHANRKLSSALVEKMVKEEMEKQQEKADEIAAKEAKVATGIQSLIDMQVEKVMAKKMK